MLSVDNKEIEVRILKTNKLAGSKASKAKQEKTAVKIAASKAMRSEKRISDSLEDYLEKIYILSLERKEVRVTDIADELQLSKPSVNRAVNSLVSEGLITHAHYGSIELTDDGKSLARLISRKNKVIKQFLVQCLEVDEDTAQEEAYNLKHHISKTTCKKLKNFLKE